MVIETADIRRSFPTARVTIGLVLSILAFAGSTSAAQSQPQTQSIFPSLPSVSTAVPDGHHDFTLRHIFHHGTYKDPRLHKRLDVPQDENIWILNQGVKHEQLPSINLPLQPRPINIYRLTDRRLATIESHLSHARNNGEAKSLLASQWTMDEVPGPNVSDKDTIVSLARAAADAYLETRDDVEWEDVRKDLNLSQSFGWQSDGLRGHIFADDGNATILMCLKGTSPAVFDGEGTTTADKVNDNLFFSCCCAQGGHYLWRQVCDCYSTTYTCNQTCLVKALKDENRYYRAAIELYTNVTELYPNSSVWLTGHSLGGAVSSLLGMTFGLPTVTFEAPGEALAASRLGLPSPPEFDPKKPATRQYTGTYHFGHTADPVFMGTCNGLAASCTLGGYAFESQCHTGLQCVYDTVSDLGWRAGIGTHKIHNVIDNVLRKYDKVPPCLSDSECVDCYNWKYFESNGSDTTTTSSTSQTTTRTRTSTCKTPGWWGCLDKTTTTTSSSLSTSAATTSTSTCKTPGWFGCYDSTTTTPPTSTLSSSSPVVSPAPPITPTPTMPPPSSRSTSSCHHRDWFGDCLDPTSSSTRTSKPPAMPHHCLTPGWFGCRDKTTSRTTGSITTMPTPPFPSSSRATNSTSSSCTQKAFFGLICLDSFEHRTSQATAPTPFTTSPPQDGEDVSWKDEM